MITSTDIEAARELLTEKWGQGAYYNSANDTYCAVGALKLITGHTASRAQYLATQLFRAAGVLDHIGIVGWNDSNDKQVVLDGFTTVAKFLRDRGE